MIVKVVDCSEVSDGRRMITVADPEGSGESSSLADVGVVWWCSVRSMGICIAKVGSMVWELWKRVCGLQAST